MTRTLEEQGFIKHDGSGMPDCYDQTRYADIIISRDHYILAAVLPSPERWKMVQYHRRHISEREQLDMAIEALEIAEERLAWIEDYRAGTRNTLGSHDAALANTTAKLKTLKERQPS